MDFGSRILRIGIFYDGNYFYQVSNYYCYSHKRRSRLSIHGLHSFVRKLVSAKEDVPERLCQIVDCHYFRGRLSAKEASARQILLNERIFDDILMREGVVTHYLPMSGGTEKGVDVQLALETLELTIFKNFNVVVLIASDGDYVPLIRKLNTLGTRVMVLGWDFDYTDNNGNQRQTISSVKLMSEASYPILMHNVIDGIERIHGLDIDSLFVSDSQNQDNNDSVAHEPKYAGSTQQREKIMDDDDMSSDCDISQDNSAKTFSGRIVQLQNGYGFIAPDEPGQQNLFFYWEDLVNFDFNCLRIGDEVTYTVGKNERGKCARHIQYCS